TTGLLAPRLLRHMRPAGTDRNADRNKRLQPAGNHRSGCRRQSWRATAFLAEQLVHRSDREGTIQPSIEHRDVRARSYLMLLRGGALDAASLQDHQQHISLALRAALGLTLRAALGLAFRAALGLAFHAALGLALGLASVVRPAVRFAEEL